MGLLQGERYGRFVQLVVDAFDLAELEMLAQIVLYAPLDRIAAPQLTLDQRALKLAERANENWVVEPVVRRAMTCRAKVPEIQTTGNQLLTYLSDSPEIAYRPPLDPYETCFVPGRLPFISRRQLRDFLRTATDPDSLGVYVVNGLTKMGKSFSWLYLESVRRAFQTNNACRFSLASINLEHETPSLLRPIDFVRRIVSSVDGWDMSTVPASDPQRYAKEIAEWINQQSLLKTSFAANGHVILVLDGFHHDALDPQTREVVQHLILLATGTIRPTNLRLLLLNFPATLIPPGVEGKYLEEPVSLLTTADVTSFFETLYRQRGRVPDPAVIDHIVKTVLAPIQPSGDYNAEVNKQVKMAVEKLG